jgi:arylsulfatase A-like enzyme
MIRWPGKIPAGHVRDEVVHGVDLLPDACWQRRKPAKDRPIDF